MNERQFFTTQRRMTENEYVALPKKKICRMNGLDRGE